MGEMHLTHPEGLSQIVPGIDPFIRKRTFFLPATAEVNAPAGARTGRSDKRNHK